MSIHSIADLCLSLGRTEPRLQSWICAVINTILLLYVPPAIASGDSDSHRLKDIGFTNCSPRKVSPDESLEGLRISHIEVISGDLFDNQRSDESMFIHTAANTLHIQTRKKTILHALPFKVGDTLKYNSLKEGERVLRSRRFLRSANVVPLMRCGTTVGVQVRTVDNWSLTPSISVNSAGGIQRYKIEVQDLNLFGLGKELTFRQSKAADKRESNFIYGDDNLFGTQKRLSFALGNSDSGSSNSISIGRPFLTSATPTSWWFNVENDAESTVFKRYDTDENVNTVDAKMIGVVKQKNLDLGFALNIDRSEFRTKHIGIGFRLEEQHTEVDGNAPDSDPTDFDVRYPYFYINWAKSDWTEQRNFLAMGKVEDIDTGFGFRTEFGLVLDALGNAENSIRFSSLLNKGYWTSPNSLHRISLKQTHYFGGDKINRSHIGARYHYFRWITEKDHIILQMVADTQKGKSEIEDFQLGGEFGLKGFRNAYQSGDTRVLGILEYRHVTDWSPLSLVNFGWGVFAEAGSAWKRARYESEQTLVDVGAGLMFSPSRSSRNEVVRLDVTFPLTEGDDVDKYLIYAGTQIKF